MAILADEKSPATPETLCSPSVTDLSAEGKGKEHVDESESIHSAGSGSQSDQQHELEAGQIALQRTITPKKPVVEVPRSERRGLFARFSLVAEVTDPTDYKNNVKWFITFIVAIAAGAAPTGSAIIFPTLDQVSRDLHTTATTANLSVALYMLSMAIFPLWWSAFSETSGRRTIYLTSFALYILFSVLSAEAKTIAMLIVMRMLAGGAAASVQAVGAGTIADIWESRERGRAMGIFYLGPLCGPLLAPVLGGVLGQTWDWRATQWALAIYGALTWMLMFLALPETLKRRKVHNAELAIAAGTASSAQDMIWRPLSRTSSTREVVHQKSKTYARIAKRMLLDPLGIILYLKYPPVLLTVYYSAVSFGSLYVLNVSIQYMFERAPYEFSTIIVGLLYLPNSLGYILASVLGGRWMDTIMKREAVKANRVNEEGKLIFRPEDRMRENAWLGAMLYPAALICYGWTTDKGVYWIVPMIANFFYGVGSMLIFAMATTMLTEFMPRKSSSGVALNNFCRNILSCIGGVVGAPLIAAIGNGWLFTILGVWTFLSASVIWAMRRFGPQWRDKYDKALS